MSTGPVKLSPVSARSAYYVTAPLLWPLLLGLRVLGLDVDALALQVGLSTERLRDPDTRVPAEQGLELVAAAIAATGDDNLGLHLAELYEPGAFGVLDHLASSARTLRDAIDVLCRYERIHQNGMVTSLSVRGDKAVIDHAMLHPFAVPRQLSENTIANLVVIGRKLTGLDFAPSEVWLAHPPPRDTSAHARFFRCPIRWRAPSDALFIDARLLDAPLLKTNSRLAELLDGYARELLGKLSVRGSFCDRVRERICVELPRGDASLRRTASGLGLSPRTLQRRLRQEGTSHEVLLDELRSNLSQEYLRQPDLGTEDVALMLGFSDSRAFRRAFKRWAGMSPSEFRASPRSLAERQ
jgi:AraC-like DNA-binding protein